MNRVAILQSNYIPWKGYFDLIASVDTFVLYDDMQYTRRDWRNRNRIKTPRGTQWLSIPVQVRGKYFQKINEVLVAEDDWARSHLSTLQQNYRSAPHFTETIAWLRPAYEAIDSPYLSVINRQLIETICTQLGVSTRIIDCRDFELVEGKSERLVDLAAQLQASHYVSGPAAKDYLDQTLFERAGIEVQWFDYSAYPEYPQLWGEFDHSVTILDLLFNTGSSAGEYMKYI